MSISISIDTSKINKDWLVPSNDGSKKYLALDVYENETPDRYGNTHAVKQSPPKQIKAELKQRGEKIPYCGNGKDWSKSRSTQAPRNQPTERQLSNQSDGVDEDVAF